MEYQAPTEEFTHAADEDIHPTNAHVVISKTDVEKKKKDLGINYQ